MAPEIRHILVVDDEEDMRELARFSLEEVEGWNVSLAASGAEAVRRAEAELPDAILLDLMMPQLDGRGTLRQLRANQRTASIPVILLTGKAQAATAERFTELDVSAVIPKPFDPFDLPRQVSEALAWRL